MSRFLNRSQFVEYILERLGDGVNRIEVTDNQIDHCIEDAIHEFNVRHHDGSERIVMTFPKVAGETEYGLPERIIAVDDVLQGRYTFTYRAGEGQGDEYLLYGRHNFTITLGGNDGQVITPYVISETYYQTLINNLIPIPEYQYSEVTHKLKFFSQHDRRNVWNSNNNVYIECRASYQEDEYPDMYNHAWLKEYCVACVGVQWGLNLTKYSGIKTPGGATLDGQGILMQWKDRKQELIDDLLNEGVPPYIVTG